MKKVFLLFGIAAFSSASAQQKDVFDMNRHIQGYLDGKLNTGKPITLPGMNEYYNIRSPQTDFKPSYSLPNGHKVFSLSQDNMPCIVPDMGQFTTMPNTCDPKEYFISPLFKNKTPGSIPNAVKPYRLVPSK